MAGNMSSDAALQYGLHYRQWFSDSDLSGVSSPETLSPDSSPPSLLLPKPAKPGYASGHAAAASRGKPGRVARVRSKQRESASEKEKLRMRDLTKALHHLRSYLPPSVAPTGQTLTKIETLRLAIRYISFLSAQLGDPSSSGLSSSSSSFSSSSSPYYYANPPQAQHDMYAQQCQGQDVALHSGSCSFPNVLPSGGSTSQIEYNNEYYWV
ncbi:mesoderm posterior protein 1-like [Stigmatopora argus]